MSEWISVEDRLPEYDEEVLIFDGRISAAIYTPRDNECDGFMGEGLDSYGNAYFYDDVTHWMPLPEPPKEDE